ncbi:GTP cyclohydrolase I [Candidatus Deianiraea vastatrix]|uniref:GTP cyclohydrolase 1 n=1 Tax=Candidatus Deianiraea vastatrix TaxID=2163644 RepID=A0A5B8XBZ1_9RICK|nr:GTP cyclohydrolase I [Candidatus Deianiraea vastatrix]QED22858.1 GTP cyclohydrolase 1 [Candidatus Deianiraea vastatrix]
MSISRSDAEKAVLTLLEYISKGKANDEVMKNTPSRVIDSFEELFGGYDIDFDSEFGKNFDNSFNYNNFVMIDNINFSSTCEHHLLPIVGVAHIAYIPDKKVIGLSKICRIVEAVSRRLQLQERMMVEILDIMTKYIKPKGSAIFIRANHGCMSLRGVKKHNCNTTTMLFSGQFETDIAKKQEFLSAIPVK